MCLRDDLEMLQALMANDASLHKKDAKGQEQIDLAGPQKDAILRAMGGECLVCMEVRLLKVLSCGHTICKTCFQEIVKKEGAAACCPTCRKPI